MHAKHAGGDYASFFVQGIYIYTDKSFTHFDGVYKKLCRPSMRFFLLHQNVRVRIVYLSSWNMSENRLQNRGAAVTSVREVSIDTKLECDLPERSTDGYGVKSQGRPIKTGCVQPLQRRRLATTLYITCRVNCLEHGHDSGLRTAARVRRSRSTHMRTAHL